MWNEIPTESILLTQVSDQIDVKAAKIKKLDNWKIHDVYSEVTNNGQRGISTRWVITEKFNNGERFIKARLVAHGFEQGDLDKLRTDSPTCGKESLQILMAMIVTNCWKINYLDIKAAFLQGKGITRDLLIKPAKEANTTTLCRLNKTVYGLNDASRTWYLRIRDEFIASGTRVSKFDEAIFFWHSKNKLQGVVCSHVDDFFWGGSVQFKDKVILQIHSKFLVSHEESTAFVYLGLEMKQLSNETHVQQSSYIKSITPICTQRGRHKTEKITEEESHQLRGLAGQFNWVAN